MPLYRVNPGDPIRAGDYNALVDAVELLMNFSAGTGMRVTVDAGGPKVALSDDQRSWKREGRITGVFRDGVPWVDDGEAQDPTRITYSARAGRTYDEAEIPPGKWARVINRPNTRGTVTVYPAKVGHECEIWRVPNAAGQIEFVLELKTEEIKFVAKCSPGGRPGGRPGDGIRETANGGGGLGIPGGLGGFGGGGSFGGSLGGTSGGSGGSGGPSSSSGGA